MHPTQYKTLRLFEGSNTSEDWHSRSAGYTKEEIANIPDPAASSRKEITSIPSPFARVHLFENAFLSVANQVNKDGVISLNAKTAYHQLVSDALDVAEIFFNYEIFNQTAHNLRFVIWKKKVELDRLQSNPQHRLIGETMELFLNQDSAKTRFDLMDNFYLLFCNNTLVGGSSPSTLFFAAYNENFKLADLGLGKGDDRFFDESPCPLYMRSKSFQRYLYGLFKVEPQLRTVMAPLWKYLEVNLKAMEQYKRNDWQELQDTLINQFDYNRGSFENEFKPAVTTDENTFIDVIRDVHHRRLKAEANNHSSDPFAIKSDKYKKGRMPLALQNHFAKGLAYCEGRWKPDIVVPYYDPKELEKRILPAATEVYPYLTVSDFLEPNIIRVSYPVEKDYFFDGNPEGFRQSDRSQGTEGIPGEDSHLLPLTKLFFDFFEPDYLTKTTPDGRPVFKMVKTGTDSVEVHLLIPIQSGDYIQFKRLYRQNQAANPEKNEGAIIPCKFDLGFFPLVHVDKEVQQIVMLTDGDILPTTKGYDYHLEFYTADGQNVAPAHKRTRQDKNKHRMFVSSKYFVQNAYYDYVQVSNGQHTGIIIPKWEAKSKGNKPITIAIDFGTTNSFISVALGDEQPQPLEIQFRDRFLVTLSESWVNTNPKQLKEVILRSLLPYTLGKGQECFLPMRTIISEIEGINHAQAIAGTDISIPFFFERRQLLASEETIANLKWLKLDEKSGDANMKRVEAYLSTTLLLARNYAIAKGGNLEDCTLVWLYPSSMGARINILNRTWQRLAGKYLGEKVKVVNHSEAIAPFYAFGKSEEKSGDKPVLNVDIGGGTTDVIILHESRPVYSTSFRFAGNTIFGNGYGNNNLRNNGLVRLLKEDIDNWFNNNEGKIFNLNDAYRGETGICKMGSADINSFFFSIEGNREVVNAGITPVSYTDILSDREDVKVAFLLFFASIVYHLAQVMKKLNLPMPRQIAFSGKGAGIVSLTDPHPSQRNAAILAQLIFQKVYGVSSYHPEGLEILLGKSPKERTCYGAINLARDNMKLTDPPNVVLLPGLQMSKDDRIEGGGTLRYKEIKDEILNQVERETRDFLDFFFELNQDFAFSKHFGALAGERLTRCKKIVTDDLRNNLKMGLAERLKSADDDDPVSESLFFYPLTGSIFQLLSHFADEAGKLKSI
jgi:hypothetical protein